MATDSSDEAIGDDAGSPDAEAGPPVVADGGVPVGQAPTDSSVDTVPGSQAPGTPMADGGADLCEDVTAIVPRDFDYDTEAPTSPSPVSGTRLQQTWVSHDSARAPYRILDTDFDTPCEVGIASDGVLRCLPADTVSLSFSDAECTEAYVVDYTGVSSCYQPEYRFAVERNGDGAPRYFLIGDERPSTSSRYLATTDGCVDADDVLDSPLDPGDDGVVLRSATEIPATAFAAVHTAVGAVNDFLGISWLYSDDGAWFDALPFDVSRGESCRVYEQGPRDDSTTVCLGGHTRLSQVSYYVDDECSELAIVSFAGQSSDLWVLEERDDEGCSDRSVYARGGQLSSIYTKAQDNTCSEWVLGTDIPLDTLTAYAGCQVEHLPSVNVELDQDAGDARLRSIFHTSEGDRVGRGSGFWDAEIETLCEPERLLDGTIVCVPVSEEHITAQYFMRDVLYADGACSTPVIERSPLACARDPLHFVTIYDPCGHAAVVHEVVGTFAGETLYARSNLGDCVEQGPASRYSGSLLELGPPLDPRTALAVLEETTFD